MVSISLNCISSAVSFSFWWLCFLLPVEGSSRRVSISYISGLIPLALFSSLFFALNLGIRRLSLSLKERLLTLDLRLKGLLSLVAISSHNFPLSQRSPFWFKKDLIPLPLSKIMCHIDLSTPLCWKREPRYILAIYFRNGANDSFSFPDWVFELIYRIFVG